MSDLERYGTCSDANGHWGIEDDGKVILSGLVSHDACDAVMDILDERDALKAEVKRLTKAIESSSYYFLSIKLDAEVENSKRINTELLALSNRQASDIRRLTKAGDALAGKAISLEYNDYWSEYEKVEDVCIDEVEAWHKAKEVQS